MRGSQTSGGVLRMLEKIFPESVGDVCHSVMWSQVLP